MGGDDVRVHRDRAEEAACLSGHQAEGGAGIARIAPGNLVSVLFGLCLALGGLYAYDRMERALQNAREATGTVIDIVHESVNKRGRMHPVVRYRKHDGAEIVGRSEKHKNLQVGEQVQIVYDVRDPERIEIGTLAQARHRARVIAGAAIAIGVASILAGVGLHFGLIGARRHEGR